MRALKSTMRLVDSLFLTIVFSLFGLLNSDSWIVLVPFIAAGGALDALKNARRFQIPINKPSRFGVWFTCIQLTFAVGAVLAFALSRLVLSPEGLQDFARLAFELGAPWIRLLRKQYQDLAAHGYDLRAAQAAVYYIVIYVLFYASLAVQSLQLHRCFKADWPFDPSGLRRALRRRPVATTFTCTILTLVTVFVFYKITFAGIEWHERGGKWRWNLHESDAVLLNYTVLMPLASGIIVFFQYWVRKASSSTPALDNS